MGLTAIKFKQSEVGLIPEDWGTIPIGALGKVLTGSTPPTNDRSNYGNDYLFVSPADLGKSKWILNTEKKLSKKGFDISRKFPSGSILFTCIGSTIGKSGIASKALTSNQQINAVLPKDKYDSEHIYYSLQLISQKIKAEAGEQAVPMVNKTEFAKFQIPLPPTLTEQKAIARVLTDTDALIQALEKKIAKKELIKKGVMQKLLTPKEGWEEKSLGEVGEGIIGLTYSPNDVRKNGTLVLRSSNIQKGQLVFIDNVFVEMDLPDRVIVKENDILICVRNGSKRLIGKCALIDKKTAGSAFGAFMTAYRSQYSDFVFYVFQSHYIQRQIDEVMGATINQITNKDLHSFVIPFPPVEEQKKIVQILSDLDIEIQNLIQKKAKYKLAKQGIIQQLLTGKIRLV